MMSFVKKKKKMSKKDVVRIVTFDLTGLLPTNHIIAYMYITTAYRVCEETFNVNSKIDQLRQNMSNFIVRKSIESTRNGKLRRLSGRFQTLIWRPGEMVQNLESPGLSGRVDSPAITQIDNVFFFKTS